MSSKGMVYRDYFFQVAQDAFNAAAEMYRGEMRGLAQDDDPSHQAPEYRAWRAGKAVEKHVPGIRSRAWYLLQESGKIVTAAKSRYDSEVQSFERSFDASRLAFLRDEFAGKIAAGGRGVADRLKEEVQQSGDAHKARALRAALLSASGELAKSSDQADRQWANSVRHSVERWAQEDEPVAVRESRDEYNRFAAEANAARVAVKQVGDEISPPEFLKPGAFDDLLGLPTAASEIVIREKDGSAVASVDWEL